MFIPETLTNQQSPQHQLQMIVQSQQQVSQFETIQFGQMSKITKIVPVLRMIKVYLMKDKRRNKNIWIEIKINQYRQQDQMNLDESSKKFQYTQFKELCRICLCDDGNSDFIRPCKCKGSLKYIHENCLKIWILEKQGIEKVYKNDIDCEVCQSKLQMETKFCDQKQLKMIQRTPKARICCWTLEIIISIGVIIAIITSIIKIINGSVDPLILAGTTVLFIILILIVSLIYISLIDQITVEVLDPWRLLDVDGDGENDSQSFSIIELENQNKQTIQTLNKKRKGVLQSNVKIIQIEN